MPENDDTVVYTAVYDEKTAKREFNMATDKLANELSEAFAASKASASRSGAA